MVIKFLCAIIPQKEKGDGNVSPFLSPKRFNIFKGLAYILQKRGKGHPSPKRLNHIKGLALFFARGERF